MLIFVDFFTLKFCIIIRNLIIIFTDSYIHHLIVCLEKEKRSVISFN